MPASPLSPPVRGTLAIALLLAAISGCGSDTEPRAPGAAAPRVADAEREFTARGMSLRTAIRLMGGREQMADESLTVTLSGRCRRFGPSRVDCESRIERSDIGDGSYEACFEVVSVQRDVDGSVRKRSYGCGAPLFRQTPRWLESERVRP